MSFMVAHRIKLSVRNGINLCITDYQGISGAQEAIEIQQAQCKMIQSKPDKSVGFVDIWNSKFPIIGMTEYLKAAIIQGRCDPSLGPVGPIGRVTYRASIVGLPVLASWGLRIHAKETGQRIRQFKTVEEASVWVTSRT